MNPQIHETRREKKFSIQTDWACRMSEFHAMLQRESLVFFSLKSVPVTSIETITSKLLGLERWIIKKVSNYYCCCYKLNTLTVVSPLEIWPSNIHVDSLSQVSRDEYTVDRETKQNFVPSNKNYNF